MLTAQDLTTLYRDHRDELVLSVYLDASQTDPAAKSAWHTRFRDEVRAVQRSHEWTEEAEEAFNAALERITAALGDPEGFLKGRGWVGFATKDKLLYAEGVPVPMPNLVRWESGIRVAPYLRALKQARPIATAIVDSRRTRLFRLHNGSLEEFIDLRADRDAADARDTRGSKRAETTSGVRGGTAKDRAHAHKLIEADRMLESAAEHLVEAAGKDGMIVFGGVESVATQLQKALPPSHADRVAYRRRLTFDLPDADIRAEVEDAASEMSRAQHVDVVGEVFDTALSGGAACVGRADTDLAIADRRVRTLYVSDTLRRAHPDEVDWLLGGAFEGGASAIEVSGEAAARLDAEAQGVAALLHYRIDRPSGPS